MAMYLLFNLPGYGNVVFVKHGSYYTVYGNLSEIYVNSSTILRAGSPVGRAGTVESEMGESIFFAVRKNNTNLNPEEWLTKQVIMNISTNGFLYLRFIGGFWSFYHFFI